MRGPEQPFEYRMSELFTKAGFLVINCARSKPFDLIASKNQIAIPLEVKPHTHTYFDKKNESQRQQHAQLSKDANFAYVVIQQLKPKKGTRGKVKVYYFFEGQRITREASPLVFDMVSAVLKDITIAT